jgi:hypothetical protein
MKRRTIPLFEMTIAWQATMNVQLGWIAFIAV